MGSARLQESNMRVTTVSVLALGAMLLAGTQATPVWADGRNPNGYGIYTPEPSVRGGPRIYRYDPRSWWYQQRGYYPDYASGYWVPRAAMRYRYRYVYYGPRFQYVPAWGYDWWGCNRCRY
jgi:hypothetical protein